MKFLLSAILYSIILTGPIINTVPGIIGSGEQPQISSNSKGVINLVFGRMDKIYCSTSNDNGVTFSEPVFVAQLPQMHLGMSRGPQIACSANYSIITAMDKSGNIHCFRRNNSSQVWENAGAINDIAGSSPEGLMSIAADNKGNFYAVWLDIRTGNKNQVYFSSMSGNDGRWSKNALVYQSPDGHVCECCKPSISAEGSTVAIMFRNWLQGARDLYLLTSRDNGRSFQAQKLGEDTWKLNGCPMDGGGVIVDPSGTIHTTWQREGFVYYCKPGERELNIGKGRTCSLAGTTSKPMISMETGDTLKLIRLYPQNEITVGTGSFLKSMALPGNKTLCVWEQDKVIKFRRI